MQNDDELQPEHQQLPPEVQALLRQGRKAQRDLEAANAAKSQMELQVALERAGVPDHPARDLVFQSYEGPLEADAIKAHAEKMGILAATPSPQSGPTADEQAAQRAILSAANGAPAGGTDVDLGVALRNAKSQSEVMAIVREVQGQPGFKNREGLVGVMPEF
jgi:hypothetical protein